MDIEEAPVLGPAALGLQRVGEEMPPRPSPAQPGLVLNRRGMPARIRKRNRLFYDDDDDDETYSVVPRSIKKGVRGPSKKTPTTPSKPVIEIKPDPIPSIPSPIHEPPPPSMPEQREVPGPACTPLRRSGYKIGMQLRNLLKLPKAHKWVCYEWFYSNIDLPLFNGDNDFMICLKEALPQLKTRKLTRAEWSIIRQMMGKPRRCSQAFFNEERHELERKRAKIRLFQQCKSADVTHCKDLPEIIPLQLVIGTKVTARLRKPQDGLFAGSIDAVDTSNNTYRITFERQGLGTHSVPDYEVLSNDPPETITVSSFTQKIRSHCLSLSTRSQLNNSLPPPTHDPMLSSALVKGSNMPIDGMLGGFPVKCLDVVVRLSKILNAKKDKIRMLHDMNAEAERRKSFGGLIAEDFQRRYAQIVIELERINSDLQGYLTSVQQYCQEIAPEPSQAALLTPAHLQQTSLQKAKEILGLIQEYKCPKNKKIMLTIQQLCAVMMQVKILAEADHSAYEVKFLQSTLEQIRTQLHPQNQYGFQNAVEIHMQHIQTALHHNGSFYSLLV